MGFIVFDHLFNQIFSNINYAQNTPVRRDHVGTVESAPRRTPTNIPKIPGSSPSNYKTPKTPADWPTPQLTLDPYNYKLPKNHVATHGQSASYHCKCTSVRPQHQHAHQRRPINIRLVSKEPWETSRSTHLPIRRCQVRTVETTGQVVLTR